MKGFYFLKKAPGFQNTEKSFYLLPNQNTLIMDTSFLSQLNWLAILVAAVAYFMLGALWYSKILFANTWIKSTGVDMSNPNAKKGVGGVMAFSFVLMFITCIGLAIIIHRLGLTTWMSGVKTGLITGICFSGTSVFISYLYQMKPKVLSFIDGVYHVVGQCIAGIILCMWH